MSESLSPQGAETSKQEREETFLKIDAFMGWAKGNEVRYPIEIVNTSTPSYPPKLRFNNAFEFHATKLDIPWFCDEQITQTGKLIVREVKE